MGGLIKPRVVILGGGVGGMTVAHQLSRPGWQARFESITLYQRGWRLGGKGASGRNEAAGDRIEEHGLHIWLGFYDNAFRMMRECYAELDRPAGAKLRTTFEAFEKSSRFVVIEDRPEGWVPWVSDFPEDGTFPGEPGARLPSPWEYVLRGLDLAGRMLRRSNPPPAAVQATPVSPANAPGTGPGSIRVTPLAPPLFDQVGSFIGETWTWALDVAEGTAEAAVAGALTVASGLQLDPGQHDPGDHDRLLSLIDLAADLARTFLPSPDQLSDRRRRQWYVADIMLACVRGVIRHGLLTHPRGLDAIDDYDFSDWLVHHGADPETARCGLVVTTVYDLQFAYAEGDPKRPSCSAAAALRGLARMFFTYHGAIAWKMKAGMGDVVFAPLYEVLADRGVTFEFFHRVDALRLSTDGQSIARIEMARQVDLADPLAGYRPLRDVDGLPCWPNQPDDTQLAPSAAGLPTPDELESLWHQTPDAAPVTLVAGTDFDVVVLAIPVGSHPFVCTDLIAARAAWQQSAERIGTIYTQAFQLWLSATMEELGAVPDSSTGGYLEPFDTYADMGQLIAAENWPGDAVRGIAYFCNAMPTPAALADPMAYGTQSAANDQVKANAVEFLRRWIPPLWPMGVQRYPTDFRWDLLVGGAASGPARFDEQFWRANVDPSERYVLPLPGTARHRLDPRASGFSNLYLAGDWTVCGINAGCVEAAVISGMLAANAIGGYPALKDIIGYQHW